MDEIYTALCEKLSEAGLGVCTVFYEDELLDALPETERNRDVLEAALKQLNNGGYIDVRYARGNAFCLSYLRPYAPPQPENTEPEEEQIIVQNEPVFSKKRYILLVLCCFLGSLLGSLCAVIPAVI